MKLACASSACAAAFERGDLTQLEFLDAVARDIACDGVVLDVRHFPRTDSEYLAQLKKMATDLGLCIAALHDDALMTHDAENLHARFAQAVALGAPLLSSTLSRETEMPWSQQLEKLGEATSLAKSSNVTLAVRNAPGTFAATSADGKRVAKETDSAWLRFGLDPDALDAASDPMLLESKTVLLWAALSSDDSAIDAFAVRFAAFRGYVALDVRDGSASVAEMQRATHRWRVARAREELNRK